MSETAMLCLGGNAPESPARITDALAFLASSGTIEASSDLYRTAPEYEESASDYYNVVLRYRTDLAYDDFLRLVKNFETGIRAENASAGCVNIDIDIVVWNGKILRPKDAGAAYFLKGLQLLGNSE